jgi:hypothetical protein
VLLSDQDNKVLTLAILNTGFSTIEILFPFHFECDILQTKITFGQDLPGFIFYNLHLQFFQNNSVTIELCEFSPGADSISSLTTDFFS